jgi:hypothetical protein
MGRPPASVGARWHLGEIEEVSDRHVDRLALAAALVVIVGIFRGLDAAITVACSLAVMEVDACTP